MHHLQACRVNLGFPDLVCDNMMDKSMNNINCGEVAETQRALLFAQNNLTTTGTVIPLPLQSDNVQSDAENFTANHEFNMEVCHAERESQKLGSTMSAYTAPFGKIQSTFQ